MTPTAAVPSAKSTAASTKSTAAVSRVRRGHHLADPDANLLCVTPVWRVPRLRIPSSAVIVRTEGPEVAVVTSDQKVHLKKITLGRDYGTEVEVTDGLTAGEEVIVTITDDVT